MAVVGVSTSDRGKSALVDYDNKPNRLGVREEREKKALQIYTY